MLFHIVYLTKLMSLYRGKYNPRYFISHITFNIFYFLIIKSLDSLMAKLFLHIYCANTTAKIGGGL